MCLCCFIPTGFGRKVAKGGSRGDAGERSETVSSGVRCLLGGHSGAVGVEVAGTSGADHIMSDLD